MAEHGGDGGLADARLEAVIEVALEHDVVVESIDERGVPSTWLAEPGVRRFGASRLVVTAPRGSILERRFPSGSN